MSTPFDFFKYRSNELCAEAVPLSRIAEELGTPVYVYSTEAMLAPLKELQKGLSSVEHLVCFAVKANSSLAMLALLAKAGAGMDLVSGGELFRAIRAGVSPRKIVFSGVGKTREEMAQALGHGILSFNVESVAELLILNDVALKLGKRAPVILRFNPNVDAKTHPYISTGLKKNKFGLEKPEIMAIVRDILDYGGIELQGISIHIGSQLLSLSPLRDAFLRVRELVDEMNRRLPVPISVVDLGGGVGIRYKKENPPKLKDYTSLILKIFGPKSNLKHPLKILIEPGRTIAGNAGVLVTEVLYRKPRRNKDFLVVDSAMNDLLRPALYGSYHDIVPVHQSHARGKKKKSDVVGPVCESTDCFASDRSLGENLDTGDLLAILSAGAYGFTMSSNYNTRPRPPEVLVHGDDYRVIRPRETYEELIRGEKIE